MPYANLLSLLKDVEDDTMTINVIQKALGESLFGKEIVINAI